MRNESMKSGWRRVKFGDVVRLSKTKSKDPLADGIERYVGLEHIEPGDLRIRKWGNVADGVTFTSLFQPGQVLFGKRRAYQRKVAVADFAGVCSSDIYVLETKDTDVLLPELLPFICQTDAFFDHAVGTSAGSLSPRTNWKSLADFEFGLPPPDEQLRMVRLLRVLEENLVSLDAALASATTLLSSRLEEALERVPDECFLSIESLVTTRPRNGISPKTNADEKGYPTLSLSAVRGGSIVTEGNLKFVEVASEQAEAFSLKQDDVLVVRGNGNKLLAGKCGLVDAVPEGCIYPDLLIRLQFNKKLIRPQFAVLQWNSAKIHNLLISRAKSTNGIWKINGADIRQHKLKAPPIEEQDVLLKQVGATQEARDELERRKTQAQSVKALFLQEVVAESVYGV